MVVELAVAEVLAGLAGVGSVAGKAIVGLAAKKGLEGIVARLTKPDYQTQLDEALESGITGFTTRLLAGTKLKQRHLEALKTTFASDDAAQVLDGLAYAWIGGVDAEAFFVLLRKARAVPRTCSDDQLRKAWRTGFCVNFLVAAAERPLLLQAGRGIDQLPEPASEKGYLEGLVIDHGSLTMKGIARPKEALSYPITDLYTPLRAVGTVQATLLLAHFVAASRHVLLIGQPGAGKTTFCKLAAVVLAKDRLAQTDGERATHLGLPLREEAPLPLFARLSHLARLMEPGESRQLRNAPHTWLLELVPDDARPIYESAFESGRAMIVLDGLDEIGSEEIRDRVARVVTWVVKKWGHNRILLTSRPEGDRGIVDPAQFVRATIEPFSTKEVETFVGRWVAKLPEDDQAQADYEPRLRSALLADRRLRRLVSNPVMLTCLCVVHWHQQELPEGKAELYQAVLRWLIESREKERREAGWTGEFSAECFRALAFQMMTGEEGRVTQVEAGWAVEALNDVYIEEGKAKNTREVRRKAPEFLDREMMVSGIVEQPSPGALRFWHLTFQEFYAADHLTVLDDDEWWEIIHPRLDEPGWRETVDLFAALLAQKSRKRARTLLRRIRDTAEGEGLVGKALVVGILGRLRRLLEPLDIQLPEGFTEIRAEAMKVFDQRGVDTMPQEDRILAAEAIGRAGDPRITEAAPDENWLAVTVNGEERPWRIAKYPVTVEEFAEFVEDGGYEESRWWDGLEKDDAFTEPVGFIEQMRTPNRPVVGVSPNEALAYCRWATSLRNTFGKGGTVTLPSQKQWLDAATGGDERPYPWGNDPPTKTCSWGASHREGRSPVGLLPAGPPHAGHMTCIKWHGIRVGDRRGITQVRY